MGDPPIEITLKTPSRLHFGMIDMRGDLGRIHGSIGVAIQNPHLHIKATKSETTQIQGTRTERAKNIINQILSDHNIKTGIKIQITQDIPEHKGYGSGTQLALSIGTILNQLYNLKLTTEQIAIRLRRGRISGIGYHTFKQGGFIIDGGHNTKTPNTVPPLIYRQDMHKNWKFIIGIPQIHLKFSGENEKSAFKKLEPPPANLVAEASRIVLMQMIPSIIETDIERFGDAITQLDAKFGDYWLKVQGGRYSHPRIEESINYLLDNGADGAGQSSWGPVLYGLVEGESKAKKLSNKLHKFLNSDENKGETFVTTTDNKGAIIEVN